MANITRLPPFKHTYSNPKPIQRTYVLLIKKPLKLKKKKDKYNTTNTTKGRGSKKQQTIPKITNKSSY